MQCYKCKRQIDIDSNTIIEYSISNLAKFAKSSEEVEKLESMSKFFFCNSMCEMLSSLNTLSYRDSPFSPEIQEMARMLAIMLIVESGDPKFRAKIIEMQKNVGKVF